MVDFVPGQDDEIGISRQRFPWRTKRRVTPGSAESGSRSSKLAIRARMGSGDVQWPVGFRRTCSRSSDILRRQAMGSANQGTMPSGCQPVMGHDCVHARSANRRASPRNLLTRRRGSSAVGFRQQHMRADKMAITRPGQYRPRASPAHRRPTAKPILAISPSRRLISAGLHALR